MSTTDRRHDLQLEREVDGEFANHLAAETSPYLKQHMFNPVDWYPWGDTALERAKVENKPIFLSIGYSACHWCHVMERESFTDAAIAEFLNEHFVSIKVDREERPDIDEIYMTAVQILTGSGGWPLNVFLTPDLEPFYGGTYFPPKDGYGRPGFRSLIQFLANAWRESPDQVGASAANLSRAIRRTVKTNGDELPVDASVRQTMVASLRRNFDSEWGGFGGAPKFPPTGSIGFLLREYKRTGSEDLLHMATLTLDRMAQGGMHDHVGGGFHRYSVDEKWLVPHFEKMLYDNALLTRVYLDAALVTGSERYKDVARRTLDFVLREMTDKSGAFHCALDADSEGEEGKFYVWSPDEIKAVLGSDECDLFCEYFEVTDGGNFEGNNVLHYTETTEESVRNRIGSQQDLNNRLAEWNERLRQKRVAREWPGKDDKVLASWNGLMISALARGYRVLRDERYSSAANRAADFIMTEMIHDGELQHNYSETSVSAFLDDYAEMANALLDLYETTLDGRRLEQAVELTRRFTSDFYDPNGGGLFFTSKSHDHILVRTKPFHDGAVPSGNSTAALVLLRLSRILDDVTLEEKATSIFQSVHDLLRRHPEAFTHLLSAVDFHISSPAAVVIAGCSGDDDTNALLKVVQERFTPNEIVALAEPDHTAWPGTGNASPLLEGKRKKSGVATAYVCQGYACQEPVTEPESLRRLLAEADRG